MTPSVGEAMRAKLAPAPRGRRATAVGLRSGARTLSLRCRSLPFPDRTPRSPRPRPRRPDPGGRREERTRLARHPPLATGHVGVGRHTDEGVRIHRAGRYSAAGLLAWNDATKGKRPGVLVVHEWWGHNAHARRQAERLAEAGYVGFALDMFGKGKLTTHPDDAQDFMTEATKDPAVVGARFYAALGRAEEGSARRCGRGSARSATASAARSCSAWRARARTSTRWRASTARSDRACRR